MEGGSDRVERLVAGAKTDTVTESLLVGGDEYTGESFLYGDAPVERLAEGERPHATLFNDMKGVGIGSKRDTVTPDGAARSVFVVTDERVLVLVGKQDGDWERSVPLADVTGAGYHTGLMKHRIVVDTVDSRYHLWVDASYEERDLDATVALLEAAGERADSDAAAGTSRPGRSGASEGAPGAGGSAPDASGIGDGGVDRTADDDGWSADGGTVGSATPSGTRDPDETAGDESGDSGGSDPLDKLERLKELHDRGVVTDAEFEAKKADLLDQL